MSSGDSESKRAALDDSFAFKLGKLFEHVRDADGLPYTGKRIAERANALGYTLSDAYVSQLRSGKARTPSFRTVEAIARAFEVSVTYFLGNPAEDLARALRRQNQMTLTDTVLSEFTAAEPGALSPETLDVLIDVLKVLRDRALDARAG